ncbi:MAG: sigma-70 family RNA polymerase sigma factor [Nitrospirae bacterium]|nr:sigma-70 family RNA polymerase sigma factor [Nitrospirota bacterium]
MNEDFELIDRFLAGDQTAFDKLVERYKRQTYQLAYRLTANHDDAAELSQEAFVRAFQGLRHFKKEAGFPTWLYRITYNLCLNHLKRNRKQREVPMEEMPPMEAGQPGPLRLLERGERSRKVREAIRRLPLKQRTTLILRVHHNLSHKEIAEVLRCSVGTVKANFFHAVRGLRELLQE